MVQSFLYSFTSLTDSFTEHLLCPRHCSSLWRYKQQKNPQHDSWHQGTYSAVENETNNTKVGKSEKKVVNSFKIKNLKHWHACVCLYCGGATLILTYSRHLIHVQRRSKWKVRMGGCLDEWMSGCMDPCVARAEPAQGGHCFQNDKWSPWDFITEGKFLRSSRLRLQTIQYGNLTTKEQDFKKGAKCSSGTK